MPGKPQTAYISHIISVLHRLKKLATRNYLDSRSAFHGDYLHALYTPPWHTNEVTLSYSLVNAMEGYNMP